MEVKNFNKILGKFKNRYGIEMWKGFLWNTIYGGRETKRELGKRNCEIGKWGREHKISPVDFSHCGYILINIVLI